MDIQISTDFIKLQQLLKLASVISQGADVKYFLEEELVKVNGVLATQRGKKVYKGDVVEVKGFEDIIVC